jgi:uncharacterized protein
MRSFSTEFALLFAFFYIILSFLTWKSISWLTDKSSNYFKKIIQPSLIIFSTLILLAFIALYWFPMTPLSSNRYEIYFWFNLVIIAVILVKLIISLGFLFGIFFSLRKKRILILSAIVLSAGILLTLLSGVIYGKNHLQIKHSEIMLAGLPAKFDKFRILHFSDLHAGSLKNSSIYARINKAIQTQNPDLLIFTGDLVNNFKEEVLLSKMNKFEIPSGYSAFAVLGNHDYGNYFRWNNPSEKDSNFQGIIASYEKLGLKLLRNENTVIRNEEDSIFIIGVENWGHPPFPQYADLEKAMNNVPQEAFKILLTHDPAHWEQYIAGKQNIGLTLSGHTHGLQWGINLAGINFSLMKFIRTNWGGLYKTEGNYLYVNRGSGTIGFPFRVDMFPEITILTLRKM